MKRSTLAMVAMMLAACGGGEGADGGDAQGSDGATDAARADAHDGALTDGSEAGNDAGGSDATVDGVSTRDVQIVDSGTTDAQVVDTGGADVQGTDVQGTDVQATDVPGTDVQNADVQGVDVPGTDAQFSDGGCAANFALTVTAPQANEVIETCTRSGAAISYDFTVTSTLPVTSMTMDWYPPNETPPTGNKVAPTWTYPGGPIVMNGAAYVGHRQVGGLPVIIDGATSNPPLATAPSGTRGTWTFYVVATDACGRTQTASQPFTLTATRLSNCPNP